MSSDNLQSQSPSQYSSPSESSQESLPGTDSGTVSGAADAESGTEKESGTTVYNVEMDTNSIVTELQRMNETLEIMSARQVIPETEDTYLGQMYELLQKMQGGLYMSHPEYYSAAIRDGVAADGYLMYAESFYQQNNVVPSEMDFSVLLTLFFAAFMGGFLLVSLARVCSFAIRCIKNILRKI